MLISKEHAEHAAKIITIILTLIACAMVLLTMFSTRHGTVEHAINTRMIASQVQWIQRHGNTHSSLVIVDTSNEVQSR